MIPNLKIEIDKSPLPKEHLERVISIDFSDETGIVSDRLSIEFDDHKEDIEIPRKDVKIKVSAGSSIVDFGEFVVDEVVLKKGIIKIVSKGFGTSTGIKSARSETYEGLSLKQVFKKISDRNKFESFISDDINDIQYEKPLVQQNESDLHFLTRLCKFSETFYKIHGNRILFSKKRLNKDIKGKELDTVKIRPNDIEPNWSYKISGRQNYKTAKGIYVDPSSGERKPVQKGTGEEPFYIFKEPFHDIKNAETSLDSKLAESSYNIEEFTFNCELRNDLSAESKITLEDFRKKVDGNWSVKSRKIKMGRSGERLTIVCVRAK